MGAAAFDFFLAAAHSMQDLPQPGIEHAYPATALELPSGLRCGEEDDHH